SSSWLNLQIDSRSSTCSSLCAPLRRSTNQNYQLQSNKLFVVLDCDLLIGLKHRLSQSHHNRFFDLFRILCIVFSASMSEQPHKNDENEGDGLLLHLMVV